MHILKLNFIKKFEIEKKIITQFSKCFILLIIFFLFSVCLLNAQTVLLEQNLKKDTVKKTIGQNLKHFVHFYAGISFAAGPTESDSIKINYGLSNSFVFGIRYKRKICNLYSLGYNAGISANSFNINQNKNKRFIDDSIHKKEKLILTAISLELYNRFNFGKRGNIIGKYIDLGVSGQWVARSNLYIKDNKIPAGQSKSTPIETNTRRLYFIDPFEYGVNIRLGINRLAIYADYRLSDMFKKSSGLQELPRLFIGIQIGLY